MPEACTFYFISVVKGEGVAKMDQCRPRLFFRAPP